MARILSIDPSGTGTTGVFFVNGKVNEFHEFKSNNWQEHYTFITNLIKKHKLDALVYENTNYIHKRTKDGLNLFRLLGALECMEVKEIRNVNVLRVKELTKQLLKGTKKIAGLVFKLGRGKGWMFKGKRISKHCLDALLVYWLWKVKNI